MKNPAVLISFLFLFLFSSCVFNRQRQVWLGGLHRTHDADDKNIVRVYFDKMGNLYPDERFFIPYKDFFDPVKGKKVLAETSGSGNLESYYIHHGQEQKKLAAGYRLISADLKSAKDSFDALQGLISLDYANKINSQLANSETKTMVVLIHGFNDPDPTGDYQQMRDAIRSNGYDKGQFVYLEVFWDGLTANLGNPVFAGIWKKALQNAAYVSLGLRQLLYNIDSSANICIITHSLGASVGTGAIFNTVTKWGYREYKRVQAKSERKNQWSYLSEVEVRPTPRQNICIGMIAPAIPGGNTFIDFNKRNPDIGAAENNIRKIVIGYNVNDYAVTKRFLKRDYAHFAGSTSLGCNLKRKGVTELERTRSALKGNGYEAAVIDRLLYPVDFSLYARKKKDEEHGLYYYIKQQDCMREFLSSIFSNP